MTSVGRLRLAALTPGLGAAVLGIGLGVLGGERLADLGLPLLAAGGLAHAWGMLDKRRQERAAGRPAPWWGPLAYWTCWISLATLGSLVAARLASIL